ncbi:MAG TPA: DUF1330 domain-containing protein [Stellaceae bacterium]|jgi:uncharacterized protein (DUF1330 family)|nr:DUF1330 domain-containing protein [Stellaceae bacterium]
MKQTAATLFALIAGIAIGAWGVPELRAQPAGGAYVVAEMHITDPAGFIEYIRREPATLAPYHGRTLARALPDVRVGAPADGMVSLIGFANAQDANRWLNSPEYRNLAPLQQKSASARIYLIDGIH